MPRKPADSLSLLMIHLQNHDSLIGQGKTVFSVAGGDQTLYGHLRNGFADLVFGDLVSVVFQIPVDSVAAGNFISFVELMNGGQNREGYLVGFRRQFLFVFFFSCRPDAVPRKGDPI